MIMAVAAAPINAPSPATIIVSKSTIENTKRLFVTIALSTPISLLRSFEP